MNELSELTTLPVKAILPWAQLHKGRFYDWRARYGTANQHNAKIPRDHWLCRWERDAILEFKDGHPLNGYRRLTYMMIDADVVSASPSTVYRVLSHADRLDRGPNGPSKKGTGFAQPSGPHAHWHVDVAYINIAGTFYYMCSVLDGYSRSIVHWDIREQMKETDIELIIQRALDKHPDVRPRIISDNGPQFLARDFRTFVRLAGMTHVRTSPYYPQSNGKIERWHRTLKRTTIRPKAPSTLAEAHKVVHIFVEHYNQERLHSAIGYITPADMLAGRASVIHAARAKKLEAARNRRAADRRHAWEAA